MSSSSTWPCRSSTGSTTAGRSRPIRPHGESRSFLLTGSEVSEETVSAVGARRPAQQAVQPAGAALDRGAAGRAGDARAALPKVSSQGRAAPPVRAGLPSTGRDRARPARAPAGGVTGDGGCSRSSARGRRTGSQERIRSVRRYATELTSAVSTSRSKSRRSSTASSCTTWARSGSRTAYSGSEIRSRPRSDGCSRRTRSSASR